MTSLQEIDYLPESKVIPGKVAAAAFSETWLESWDYTFLRAGFWGFAKENVGYIHAIDPTTFRTVAPSLRLQIPSSTIISLGQRAYWIIGIWHNSPNKNLRFDFWHRDTRSSPAGIWGKRIYYWRNEQAVMTMAWSVDAGTDAADTWLQVTNLNIPTGVSDHVVIFFSLEALTGITNAAINVWYDDIRLRIV